MTINDRHKMIYGTDDDTLRQYIANVGSVIDVDRSELFRISKAAVKASRNKNEVVAEVDKIERRWYQSLVIGQPDYSVYNEPVYVADLWSCWVIYSRKYLLELLSEKSLPEGVAPVDTFGPVKTVCDLGCGPGLTTVGLKGIFESANVYGTNLSGTWQYTVAEKYGARHGFAMEGDIGMIPSNVDVLFASEYFEHIEEPVRHAVDVINGLKPRIMIIANTFTAPSIGHFDLYDTEYGLVPNKKIGRQFNSALRDFGYIPIKTKLWNNRPMYWRHKDA